MKGDSFIQVLFIQVLLSVTLEVLNSILVHYRECVFLYLN